MDGLRSHINYSEASIFFYLKQRNVEKYKQDVNTMLGGHTFHRHTRIMYSTCSIINVPIKIFMSAGWHTIRWCFDLPTQCGACQRRWESMLNSIAAVHHRQQAEEPAPQILLPAKSGRKMHPYRCR